MCRFFCLSDCNLHAICILVSPALKPLSPIYNTITVFLWNRHKKLISYIYTTWMMSSLVISNVFQKSSIRIILKVNIITIPVFLNNTRCLYYIPSVAIFIEERILRISWFYIPSHKRKWPLLTPTYKRASFYISWLVTFISK